MFTEIVSSRLQINMRRVFSHTFCSRCQASTLQADNSSTRALLWPRIQATTHQMCRCNTICFKCTCRFIMLVVECPNCDRIGKYDGFHLCIYVFFSHILCEEHVRTRIQDEIMTATHPHANKRTCVNSSSWCS